MTGYKSRLVAFDRPVARGVGGQHLVHQGQGAVFVEAELELGVGNDDALGQRKSGGGLVNLDTDFFDLRGQFGANDLLDLRVADVFVMLAGLGLGGGREDRLGQLAGVFQAGGQRHAADRLRGLVFLPAAAGQVAAHHGLDRNRLEPLDQHRAAYHLRQLGRCDHALGRLASQVVGADVAELAEPEQRHLREQRAFAGDRLTQNHIKSAEPVAGDHQQAVFADGVVVAYLAARQQRQRRQGGGVQRCGHGVQRTTWANSPLA